MTNEAAIQTQPDRFWYKDAIIYELHVRAFHDSNGDGIGDFPGLTQKLDFLQDLGVTALWLLPFYPSPLKDDGYDIADYYSINPIYGTLDDFKTFLDEAHKRRLRVITELVVNHTSDQHPWFQKSRRAAPDSAWRHFYVWSETPSRYKEARIIFKDFEPSNWSWDGVAKAYYWHRFYAHQPDLNYDNPLVQEEVLKALDFWLDLGVDGVRLDAVPYLYERDGTSCENLPETHGFLKKLRRHVDEKYGDRMLLAEANQWPEDSVTYFGHGAGDECHMAFHFPLMPRLFMSLRMEDRAPLIDILDQTPAIPETSQWALFLRNHDELTLEMVTDEERDYMYRVYAADSRARINLGIRRRLAPLLGNDRKRIELMNLLLLSMPGTPVIYYGDEIGMGDNIFLGDRNGVRTPMQWSSDKNAGFSRASPQALFLPIILEPEYHYEAINVETQQGNPHSLLWWMKRVLALRKRFQAFGRGTLEFLQPENRNVLAFIRRFENQQILVVANLSRFPQPVTLDLSPFNDLTPVELFGRTEFPRIGDAPYLLTLSPHAALWFSLERIKSDSPTGLSGTLPAISVRDMREPLAEWFDEKVGSHLDAFLKLQPWFAGKHHKLISARIAAAMLVGQTPQPGREAAKRCFITIARVEYTDAEAENYFLPLAIEPESGAISDAINDADFCAAMFDMIAQARRLKTRHAEIIGSPQPDFARSDTSQITGATPLRREQSNTSIVLGNQFILKFYRRLDGGVNTELELNRLLAAKRFPHLAPFKGALELQTRAGQSLTLAVLHEFMRESRPGWDFTLDALGRFFERISAQAVEAPMNPATTAASPLLPAQETSAPAQPGGHGSELTGTYLEFARRLGQRAGELHLALASESDPLFAPEPFTPFYQRSLYQSMRNTATQSIAALRQRMPWLPPELRGEARAIVAAEAAILQRLRAVADTPMDARRFRCHGNLHLGEILHTGKDFIFVDVEGDSSRPLGERRIKRPAVYDLAAMLRSFHLAAHCGLLDQLERGALNRERLTQWNAWVDFWHRTVSAVFIEAYVTTTAASAILPSKREHLHLLLTSHLLAKTLSDLGRGLNPRLLPPSLRFVLQLMNAS